MPTQSASTPSLRLGKEINTLISANAASSLATLRDTMIRLAPLAANCFATLLPMPSEAPVSRTVC